MEKRNEIKRIAILGAESTGKTTLARSLALRFHTEWVPEYAREYISMHTDSYSHEDIVKIAEHQLQEEEELIKTANKLIFTDTEFIIAKVWSEDVFGFTPEYLTQKIREHHYDLFLLTANDLPWIPDPVRINPQRRDYFFNLYKKELEQNGFAYEVVSGRYEARLFNAVSAIKKHFSVE